MKCSFSCSSLVAITLVLGAPASAQDDATLSARVDIVLADFSFTPSDLRLSAGKKVVLHFSNQGSGGHNFSAPDFFAAATIDPASARLIANGKVDLKKGTSADIILTPKAGHYSVKCTHFLHSGFGMKGGIIVE